MKYCKNCGSQINDEVVYCPHCGASTEASTNTTSQTSPMADPDFKRSETLGWVAIWVGFFVTPLVAFICGGIGLSKASKTGNSKGRTLCIVGIILGVVAVILNIFVFNQLLEQLEDLINSLTALL